MRVTLDAMLPRSSGDDFAYDDWETEEMSKPPMWIQVELLFLMF